MEETLIYIQISLEHGLDLHNQLFWIIGFFDDLVKDIDFHFCNLRSTFHCIIHSVFYGYEVRYSISKKRKKSKQITQN